MFLCQQRDKDNMDPTMFKTNLSACIDKVGLGIENWAAEEWKVLGTTLTQEIANDAFSHHEELTALLAYHLDQKHYVRPKAKDLKRIEKKLSEQYPGRENYFKVLSDLLAVRIHCDVTMIAGIIGRLQEIFGQRGSQIYLRGVSHDQPLGSFFTLLSAPGDKKLSKVDRYLDIVQYLYVYDPIMGYLIEIQVGHPFAGLTFEIDSALRDNKDCGLIDLWSDGFYGHVKQHILEKANGDATSLSLEELMDKARSISSSPVRDIHGGSIPQDLLSILANL